MKFLDFFPLLNLVIILTSAEANATARGLSEIAG